LHGVECECKLRHIPSIKIQQIYIKFTLLFCDCHRSFIREFRVALSWELLYADDLVVIAETEDYLIKRLNEWKDNVENIGVTVNMNKNKVMISVEWQKVMQNAARWPAGVCGTGVGNNSIQCTSCQKWVNKKCSV